MATGVTPDMDGSDVAGGSVGIELSPDERDDLAELLAGALGDMSSEIADTDNPSYRAELVARRDRLRAVAERVSASRAAGPS